MILNKCNILDTRRYMIVEICFDVAATSSSSGVIQVTVKEVEVLWNPGSAKIPEDITKIRFLAVPSS